MARRPSKKRIVNRKGLIAATATVLTLLASIAVWTQRERIKTKFGFASPQERDAQETPPPAAVLRPSPLAPPPRVEVPEEVPEEVPGDPEGEKQAAAEADLRKKMEEERARRKRVKEKEKEDKAEAERFRIQEEMVKLGT